MIKYWGQKIPYIFLSNLTYHLNFEIGIKFSNTDYIQSELADRIYLKFTSLVKDLKNQLFFLLQQQLEQQLLLLSKLHHEGFYPLHLEPALTFAFHLR